MGSKGGEQGGVDTRSNFLQHKIKKIIKIIYIYALVPKQPQKVASQKYLTINKGTSIQTPPPALPAIAAFWSTTKEDQHWAQLYTLLSKRNAKINKRPLPTPYFLCHSQVMKNFLEGLKT